MYIFIEKDDSCSNIPFVWLSARDRSVWEVAWYFQSGYLKREFIETRGNRLSIRVVNSENYLLKPNWKYHFVFTKDAVPGYMKIKLPFPEGSFVADWYRLELNENSILPSTWEELFGKQSPPFPLPDEDAEYSDYVEETYTLNFRKKLCRTDRELHTTDDDTMNDDDYRQYDTQYDQEDDIDMDGYAIDDTALVHKKKNTDDL